MGEFPRLKGYEIHAGITTGIALDKPVAVLQKENVSANEGAISIDGQVLGTYLHGIFDSSEVCDELLKWAGMKHPQSPSIDEINEAGINRLADALDICIDKKLLSSLIPYPLT
jgi:adenosylcobyric acid synthase